MLMRIAGDTVKIEQNVKQFSMLVNFILILGAFEIYLLNIYIKLSKKYNINWKIKG